MLSRFVAALIPLCLMLLLGACSEEELDGPAPTSTWVTLEFAPTPTPIITQRVPNSVWLIDARDGGVTTLLTSDVDDVRYAAFDPATGDPLVGIWDDSWMRDLVRYNLSGKEIGRELWAGGVDPQAIVNRFRSWIFDWLPGAPVCEPVAEGARIDGRVYAGIGCGPISPDERWMLFEIDHSPDLNHDVFERWAIDLFTDRRWFLADQDECQADGLFLPGWSPSGRYVYFGDCGYNTPGNNNSRGRIFLSDMVAGTTRQITTGGPSILLEPVWSPVADVLAYRARDGIVTLSDLSSGTLTAVPELPWPVRFDPTGTLLYPERSRLQNRTDTALYSIPAKRIISTLPGLPPARTARSELSSAFTPVMATQTGFIAVLEEAPGCQGATVYVDQTVLTCVVYGVGPTISPNGYYIALPRYDGFSGSTAFPGGGGSTMWRYEIVIVEVATGTQHVVADGVLGAEPVPIALPWNESGTHILVAWPFRRLGP